MRRYNISVPSVLSFTGVGEGAVWLLSCSHEETGAAVRDVGSFQSVSSSLQVREAFGRVAQSKKTAGQTD
ncbi:hypothetical protein Q5P01_012497 [Channa striata]|uniref:Uncharacterized protein n=1 Tax=Channa striata TaxID=64152 RepID=A0AA88MNP8_CHASR|nr:hypothetical protein Q5P01_012497 [Channa striata]